MLTGLFTAANALDAFQTSFENTSNTLANVNTTGFKATTLSFQDLPSSGPSNAQIGRGVNVSAISPNDFKEGPLQVTGRDLDVAISGKGLMVVQLPDGTIKFTRDGSLHRDSTGQLVTDAGNIVQPPITIPSDTLSTSISADGTVTVTTSSAPGVPKVLGQIQLARFVNQDGLLSEPGNLYSETVVSGPPTIATPGTIGLGEMVQKSLEQSNVDVTTELTALVTAQGAYSANSKVIKTSDQLISSALSLVH
jgi:flagellar basal-body rod protein FlgG